MVGADGELVVAEKRLTEGQCRPHAIIQRAMREHAPSVKRRAPWVAFDEKFGQMHVGEHALVGPVVCYTREPVQQRKYIPGIDGSCQRPLDLAAELLRLIPRHV